MTRTKGTRGRPTIDDAEALAAVADFVVANPSVRSMTAMLHVVKSRGGEHSEEAAVRRLRRKWVAHQAELVAEARRARAERQWRQLALTLRHIQDQAAAWMNSPEGERFFTELAKRTAEIQSATKLWLEHNRPLLEEIARMAPPAWKISRPAGATIAPLMLPRLANSSALGAGAGRYGG